MYFICITDGLQGCRASFSSRDRDPDAQFARGAGPQYVAIALLQQISPFFWSAAPPQSAKQLGRYSRICFLMRRLSWESAKSWSFSISLLRPTQCWRWRVPSQLRDYVFCSKKQKGVPLCPTDGVVLRHPVGNPKRKVWEAQQQVSLSCETKVYRTSRRKPNFRRWCLLASRHSGWRQKMLVHSWRRSFFT
jgi:hypothetical protein